MGKKLTYEFVRNKFEERGYTLLSREYINSGSTLLYKCKNGHERSVTWDRFKQGVSCSKCRPVSNKLTYKYVKEGFGKVGYELLSTNYINNRTELKYKCNKGHVCSIKWRDFRAGCRCPVCAKLNKMGEGNPNWKGGIRDRKLPLYNTYAHQLEKYQPVHKIKQDTFNLLGVECTYCGKIFVPTVQSIKTRLNTIKGKYGGEQNLYCAEECKQACPTYGQNLWPKDHKSYENSRPNQKQWATLVKERDNYTCQKCGTLGGTMVAHHIDPVINNPVESADIDNGKTLCEACDKLVHQTPGCSYTELRC